MTMKRILVISAFALGLGTTAFAQSADERIGQLMNEENWFELYHEYAAAKDSLSPFLYDFGKAILDTFYNRPEAACASIGKLLNERQSEMGFPNTCSMISFMASNLGKLGKNLEAADLLKDFCNQLEEHVDSSFLATYRQQESQYRELSTFADINQWNKPGKDLKLPFLTDSTGITLQGTLNGKEQRFLLDTGAGVNVVTPEVAKMCNMKMLDATTITMGIKIGTGSLALAEELKIGDLIMRNVVFTVLDLTSGHTEADKYLEQLGVIIGIPLLNELQEVTLDFQNNELTVPVNLSTSPDFAPNLCVTDGNQLYVAAVFNNENMGLILDTGSDWSRLGYDYYQKHKRDLESTALCDSTGVGGVGGVMKVKVYRLSDVCLQIGRNDSCTDSLDVVGQKIVDQASLINQKGVIGMNLIHNFAAVTINLKDMFITTTPRN